MARALATLIVDRKEAREVAGKVAWTRKKTHAHASVRVRFVGVIFMNFGYEKSLSVHQTDESFSYRYCVALYAVLLVNFHLSHLRKFYLGVSFVLVRRVQR